MGMPQWTLRVRFRDAERPELHSHAERGNDQSPQRLLRCRLLIRSRYRCFSRQPIGYPRPPSSPFISIG
ncbi:hypothetical protein C1Y11_22155 [Pseudomonas sp. FW305-20]|nr:hypothetical protein C1Y11_22155 [Pseudomonas sp. FW305-20]PMU14391.1 hypothetical protein C1Y10_25535 [Pseudomonas sp. FW305-122]PMU36115.1 hypothetical protein C1Y12_23565 [Pseudomonas sp. FW305-47B]PMX60421.1 hypothetical protein C1Y13_14870 [Pseudomonas sp. FW305-33]PMX65547.1 hypothetical protein C1X12_19380 [Pseudomonas sp. FW305-60]